MVPRALLGHPDTVNHYARRWLRGTAFNGISILRGTTSLRSESFINLTCDLCAVCLSFSFLSFFSVVSARKKEEGLDLHWEMQESPVG